MSNASPDFQSANEIGKIYQSLNDRPALAGFFLESASKFTEADAAYLFLAGANNRLWLDSSLPASGGETAERVRSSADTVFASGRPFLEGRLMAVPLLVRSDVVGVAVFERNEKKTEFDQNALNLALALGSQMAGSMKNILLFEENLRMERLAAVGQTTGMVIHEIKNIMQLAKLSYEFLKRGHEKKNEQFLERGIVNIAKALRELEGFTMDMLSLTRDYEIETEKVDLARLAGEIQSDLQIKAEELGVKLECSVPEGFGEVDADARSIYRTLINLVKNALEASDPAKKDRYVRLRAEPAGKERYRIIIEDNGIGMSEEVRARLFEAFFSTKGKQGTGLGLLIIDRTVRKHHGTVEIESREGEWTRFALDLPVRIAGTS